MLLEKALRQGHTVIEQGQCASYIPELQKADPNQLALSIRTVDGQLWHSGNYAQRFTIQSISKVIMLILAFDYCGYDAVFSKVGMEPSGEAFNAFVDLATTRVHPTNPMINAGALTVVSLLEKRTNLEDVLSYTRRLCMDDSIALNEAVYKSEMINSARNHSIAYLLKSKGIIEGNVEHTIDFYTRMCALQVTSDSLANFASVLAYDGKNPITGQRFLSHRSAQIAKTIMLTCGMYDGSGEFAVRVGVPAKSGVGGGILAVSDNRMGIGIFGPALDSKGNSIAGQKVLEYLSQELDLHLFGRDDAANYNRFK